LSLRVTLLGSGTSHGVPMIGCDCGVCRSTDPKDRRNRTSILLDLNPDGLAHEASSASAVAVSTRFVLVDTSSDLRAQALAYGVRRVDAILFTHSHADHIFGLDEVRRYNHLQKEAIPCYADARTSDDLRRVFAYIFDKQTAKGGGIPNLVLSRIVGPFSAGGVEIVPVPVMHGTRQILGFRAGSFAYLTDCSAIPDASWPLLTGVKTLVLDALREKKHPTHFNVSDAVDAAARIGADRTYLTHISHDLGHEATCARLPRGVELAYDGLVLDIPDEAPQADRHR
jgi:phosphoribosyl 1,2-cyclic phosphate phosphodiesterase